MDPSPRLAATAAGGERMPPTALRSQEPCGGKGKTPGIIFPKPTRLPKTFAALQSAGVAKKRSNNNGNCSIIREDAMAAEAAAAEIGKFADGSSCGRATLVNKNHVMSFSSSSSVTVLTDPGRRNLELGTRIKERDQEQERHRCAITKSQMSVAEISDRKSTIITPEAIIESRHSQGSSIYHDLDFTRNLKDDEKSLRSTDLSDSSSIELCLFNGGGGGYSAVKSTSVSPKPDKTSRGMYHHSRPSCGVRIVEMRASRKQEDGSQSLSSLFGPFCTTTPASSRSNAHTPIILNALPVSETIARNDVIDPEAATQTRHEGGSHHFVSPLSPFHRSSLDLNVTYVEHFDERPHHPDRNRISLDSDVAGFIPPHGFTSRWSNSGVTSSSTESKTSSASSSYSMTNSQEQKNLKDEEAMTTNDVGASKGGDRKQTRIAAQRKHCRLQDVTARLTRRIITGNGKQHSADKNKNVGLCASAGASDSPSCIQVLQVQTKHALDYSSRRKTSSRDEDLISDSSQSGVSASTMAGSRSGTLLGQNSLQSKQHLLQLGQQSLQSGYHSLQSGNHSLQSGNHSLQPGHQFLQPRFNDSLSSSDDTYSPANSSTDTLIDSFASETSFTENTTNNNLAPSAETDPDEQQQQHSTFEPHRSVDVRLFDDNQLKPSGESISKREYHLSQSRVVSNPPLVAGKSTSSLHTLGFRKINSSSQAINLTLSTSCLTQKNSSKQSPPVSYPVNQKLKNIQRVENFGRASEGVVVVSERHTHVNVNLSKANSSSDLYRTTNANYRLNTTITGPTKKYTVNEGLIQKSPVQNSKLKIPVSVRPSVQCSILESSCQVAVPEGRVEVNCSPSLTTGAKGKKRWGIGLNLRRAAAATTAVCRLNSTDSDRSTGNSKQSLAAQHSPAIPIRVLPSAAVITPIRSYRQPPGDVGRRLATTTATVITNRPNRQATPENIPPCGDHFSSKPLSPISEKQNSRSSLSSRLSIPAGETTIVRDTSSGIFKNHPHIGVHRGLPKSATSFLRGISAQRAISMSKISSSSKSNSSRPVATDGRLSTKPDLRQRPFVTVVRDAFSPPTRNLLSEDMSEISQSYTNVFARSSSSTVVGEFAAEGRNLGGNKLNTGSCFALNVSLSSSSSIVGGAIFSKQRKGSSECVKIDKIRTSTDSVKIERPTSVVVTARSMHSIGDNNNSADAEQGRRTLTNAGEKTENLKQPNLRTAIATVKFPQIVSSKLKTPTNFIRKKSSDSLLTHDTVKETGDLSSVMKSTLLCRAETAESMVEPPISVFTQLQLKHVKPYTSSAAKRGASSPEKFNGRQSSVDGHNKARLRTTNSRSPAAKMTDQTCQLDINIEAQHQVEDVGIDFNIIKSVNSTAVGELSLAEVHSENTRLDKNSLRSGEESSPRSICCETDAPVNVDYDDDSDGKHMILLGSSSVQKQSRPFSENDDCSKIEFEEVNSDLLNACDPTNDNETNGSGKKDVSSLKCFKLDAITSRDGPTTNDLREEFHLTEETSVETRDRKVYKVRCLPVAQHQSHFLINQTNDGCSKAQRNRCHESYRHKHHECVSSDTDDGSSQQLNRLSGGNDEFSSEAEHLGSLDRRTTAVDAAAGIGHHKHSLNECDESMKTIPGTTVSKKEENDETCVGNRNTSAIRESTSKISRADDEYEENPNYGAEKEMESEDLERLSDDRMMEMVFANGRQGYSFQKTLTDAESQCDEIIVPSSNRNSLGLPGNILIEPDTPLRDIEKFIVTYESDTIIVLERADSLQVSNSASKGIDLKTAGKTGNPADADASAGNDSAAASAMLRRIKDGLLLTKCSDFKATTFPQPGSELGNLPLSESGYDSWKSQSSQSSARFSKLLESDSPVIGSLNCFQETFFTNKKTDGHNCQPIRECFYDHSSLESDETPRESLVEDVTCAGSSFDEFHNVVKPPEADNFSYERNGRLSSSVSTSSFLSSGSSFMDALDSSSNSLFLAFNATEPPRRGITAELPLLGKTLDSPLIGDPSSSSSFEKKDCPASKMAISNGSEYADQLDAFEETLENSYCKQFSKSSAFYPKDYHNRIYKLDFGSTDGDLTVDEERGSFNRIPSKEEPSLQTWIGRHSSSYSEAVEDTKNSQSGQVLRSDQQPQKQDRDSKSQSRSGLENVHCLTFPLTTNNKPLSDVFQRDHFNRPKEMLAKALAESCAGLLNSSSKAAAASKNIIRETYYENVCDELLEGFEANLSDSDHTSPSPIAPDLEDGVQTNECSSDSLSLQQSQSSPELLLDEKVRYRIIPPDDGADLNKSVTSSKLDALEDDEETGSRRSSDVTSVVQY